MRSDAAEAAADMVIRFFAQSATHREFSNFAPFAIDLDGARWATVENYYQAQKFIDPDLRQSIGQAEQPIIAKTLADANKGAIRPDWDAIKDEVMYRRCGANSSCIPRSRPCCLRPVKKTSPKPIRPTAIGASAATAQA
jgi:ribA/ribD-fused uncharacterized protein